MKLYVMLAEVLAADLRLYWQARRNDDPAHRWLREAVMELVGELWG